MEAQPGTATALDAEPVPHAEPGREASPARPAGSLTDDQLNKQISDVFTDLIKHAHDLGQKIATENGLTGSDAMALFKLETPMTTKELGLRMGCDPSFITTVADALDGGSVTSVPPLPSDAKSSVALKLTNVSVATLLPSVAVSTRLPFELDSEKVVEA